jgi:large subunit ribosomal protein L2
MKGVSIITWKKKSFKKLGFGLPSSGGRTSSGRTSLYHHGSGSFRLWRVIDYKRFVWNVPGVVARIEYNPFIRSLTSLIVYCNGIVSYILTPFGAAVGSIVRNQRFYYSDSIAGNCFSLFSFPIGSFIHNLELHSTFGGQLLRTMGSYGRIMSKSIDSVVVKLKSGRLAVLPEKNIAVLGTLDSFRFQKRVHYRAGFFRLLGIRPTVRGVAMNPIDHPHGGGEGKSSAGRPSVSRWGWLTKNVKKKS